MRILNKIEMIFRRVFSSQLGQNIITNYLSVIWMGGLGIVLIPFYLKRLGADQWGVVAICMAIQGFLGLLDAGLGQIMPRDIARAVKNPANVARVYFVFSRAYIGLGVFGLILGQISVPWLLSEWFNLGEGGENNADTALRLVLVQFVFQFANNANSGYWNGVQAQKLANIRQCFFGTCKHIGALCLIFYWRADAVSYLVPFAIVSGIEWGINRRRVMAELGENGTVKISLNDFRILSRETGLLAMGVLLGMLVAQVDRIVLSRSVSIESFGYYVIVANLGLAFMQLQHPLMRAFFPRIVHSDLEGGTVWWQLGLSVSLFCILPCVLAIVGAAQILEMWIGGSQIVMLGTIPLQLILIAASVNAIYHLIYQRIIAIGHGRIVLFINLIALLVVTIVMEFTVDKYGIAAGGIAWLAMTSIQLTLGSIWLFNRLKNKRNKLVK